MKSIFKYIIICGIILTSPTIVNAKNKNEIVDSREETIYQKVVSDEDKIISIENITEAEYNSKSDKKELICDAKSVQKNSDNNKTAYIETSYKKLDVRFTKYNSNDYELLATLTWKRVPACRSYDIFAFRTSYMSHSNVVGFQTYYVGNKSETISYNKNSEGYKNATNGVGFSMNLKDGSNITKYEMNLWADLKVNDFNYKNAHVYTTYQHATTDLSRAQSMSYTISAGGLGDVLLFNNNTIQNKYDDMAGIHLSLPI